MSLATSTRNVMNDARTALVNGGKLRLKAGATTRLELTLEATAFGASSSGVATAASFPKSGNLTSTGDLDTWEAVDSSNAVRWSGTIGTTADGPDGDSDPDPDRLVLPQVAGLAAGVEIRINSWTCTQPA